MVAPSTKKPQDADVISFNSVVASPSDSMAIVHLPFCLPYPVTHMCHDITGLTIMAGRLGAFCHPLEEIACHGLIVWERVFLGVVGAQTRFFGTFII